MRKVDLKKELEQWYRASAKEVVAVEAPVLQFLMIDGEGDPNTPPEYAAAVEALLSVSYGEIHGTGVRQPLVSR
jgi:hypothetical protein